MAGGERSSPTSSERGPIRGWPPYVKSTRCCDVQPDAETVRAGEGGLPRAGREGIARHAGHAPITNSEPRRLVTGDAGNHHSFHARIVVAATAIRHRTVC